MNGPLREASVTDPEWAKKEQRREWLLKAVTAGVIIALTVGVVTIVQNRGQDAQITKVTRKVESACAVNAAGERCQDIKREGDEVQSIPDACVQFRKVGYPCPRPGSAAAERQEKREQWHREAYPQATDQPSTGGSENVPTGGDVDNGAGKGGAGPDREPGKGGSDAPSAPGSGGSGGGEQPPAAAPPDQVPASTRAPSPGPDSTPPPKSNSPGLIESVTGPVAEGVEQAGREVEGAVDRATCNPVVALCPR